MFGAMLRGTVSPTMLDAGFAANAIPGEAKATLNVRLLPGTDPEHAAHVLRQVVADSAVAVTYDPPDRPEAPAVPFAGPVVEAIREVAAAMAPGAPVVPLLSTGATDSATLRRAGIAAYGILPFPLSVEDAARMHGNDERMPVESLVFGFQMVYRVTARVAGRQLD
jgi:acetylornithine deacetylase/succinyl-diaminopimelate desuccinylase-like protein